MSTDDFDEEFDDYEREILANIEAFGCFIPYIFYPDGVKPSFAYSVGFTHSLDQGEVIIFGLSQDVMHFMINQIYRQCRDEGLILADNLKISGLLEGFDTVARIIPPGNIRREFFNSAMWHHFGRYGSNLVMAYQIVWPSALTGLFPWQEGCADNVIAMQPALYETRQ